jgi:hypothetical protein
VRATMRRSESRTAVGGTEKPVEKRSSTKFE